METQVTDDEWSNVPKIEAKYANNEESGVVDLHDHIDLKITPLIINQIGLKTIKNKTNETKVVSFHESIEHLLKSFNMYDNFDSISNKHYYHSYAPDENTEEKRHYVDDMNKNILQRLFQKLFGPAKLNEKYVENRDFIYLLVSKKFDDNCIIHKQILFTLYKKLTNTLIDCPRYGHHWEIIGFQGTDPVTDLRGCGILSLVLLLYLLEIHNNLTQNIYRLSQHDTQNFPFCAMAINITRIVLNVMNLNLLNNLFNKSDGSVINVCGQFFAALYCDLYLKWTKECKTINDCGFVLSELEIKAKKSPIKLIKQLEKYIKPKKKFRKIPKIVIDKAESTDQEFSQLE